MILVPGPAGRNTAFPTYALTDNAEFSGACP